MTHGPTIVFFPEGAFGPTNNCVGIGNVLRRRGARVVFVVEESFEGTLEAKGFEEATMRLKPAPEIPEEPGQFWKDFVRETAPAFRESTTDQLAGVIKPVWEELVAGARYVAPRLTQIFAELRPDVIVEDNVVAFPAVPAAGAPWVRIVSCNPLELKDPDLPPAFSGLATGDRSGWAAFRRRYGELHGELQRNFGDYCEEHCGQRLPDLEFMLDSPFLNLYLYPRELDYPRARPLGPTWHRLESCVRTTDEPFELPESVHAGGGKLLYLSLGSLGSADVGLMTRLIDVLSRTPHRVLVSKGPQHEQIALGERMYGAEFLPQANILPQVDLVITHGGNNTVTECLHFGKPMIVLPLFWDQHDNAQRVHETGYGVRLATYGFTEPDFREALQGLLESGHLRRRMALVSRRLQTDPGTHKAADLIWRLAHEKQPVTA